MRDDSGASNPMAFLIAGVLALTAIASLVFATGDVGSESHTAPSTTQNLQSQAASLLDLMLLSSGYVGDDPPHGYASCDALPVTAWVADENADCLERMGLMEPTGGRLNLTKFRNLKDSPFGAAEDGFVNYVEARKQFGLDERGMDFHIRAYPTLKSVQDILASGEKDPNLRITYIGNEDVTGGTGPPITDLRCDESPADSKDWRFTVTVENVGVAATQFHGVFDLDFGSESLTRKDQTGIVAASGLPGSAVDLWVDVANTADVTCDASTAVTVSVYDPSTEVGEQAFTGPTVLGSPTGLAPQAFSIELDALHYATVDTIQVGYTGADRGDAIAWEVREGTDPAGALATCDQGSPCQTAHTVPNAQSGQHIDISGLVEGVFTVVATHESGVVSTQRLLVTDTTVSAYSSGSSAAFDQAMAIEVGFLDALVEQFCPAHFDNGADSVLPTWDGLIDAPDGEGRDAWDVRCEHMPIDVQDTAGTVHEQQVGDVFWDDKQLLTSEVCKRLQRVHTNGACSTGNPPRLDLTNVLVVGSNVDHHAMTSGGFKWPLRDWVQAGGTLIVFGSPDQSTQWIEPIFHVGEQSSSGGISAPDLAHPLLTVPDDLNYDGYDNRDQAWYYTGDAGEHFTNVTKQGDDPITAISDPGSFGKGTVIVTTWPAYDLFGDGAESACRSPPFTEDDDCEGLRMINNFLTQAYRDLFLDYGPEIPDTVEVVPAFKRAQIEHDRIGLVDLDMALFVFPHA